MIPHIIFKGIQADNPTALFKAVQVVAYPIMSGRCRWLHIYGYGSAGSDGSADGYIYPQIGFVNAHKPHKRL
jgi:hypothetical protein